MAGLVMRPPDADVGEPPIIDERCVPKVDRPPPRGDDDPFRPNGDDALEELALRSADFTTSAASYEPRRSAKSNALTTARTLAED